jgi:cysteinyl-tRNA synthetase
MDDDFNTPQAIGALFDLDSVLQRYGRVVEQSKRPPEPLLAGVGVLQLLGRVLGLLWWQVNPVELPEDLRAQIDPLIAEREEARKRQDWKRADELRAELDALGVVVEDTPRGPQPRRKSPSTSPQ